MTPTDKNSLFTDQKLSAILAEYNMLRADMKLYMQFLRRDSQLIVAVLAAVFGTSLWKGSPLPYRYLSLFVPSVLFIYLALLISNFYFIVVESKACARIERRVQLLYGDWLMDWETIIVPATLRGIKTPNTLVIYGIFLLFFTIFIYFSIEAIFHFGLWTVLIHGVECIVLLLSFILGLRFESMGSLPPLKDTEQPHEV